MSDQPKQRSLAWIGWVLLALPVLYLLSLGPVVWLCHHDYLSLKVAFAIGTPAEWAYDRSTTFQRCWDWYANLWIGK